MEAKIHAGLASISQGEQVSGGLASRSCAMVAMAIFDSMWGTSFGRPSGGEQD